MIRSIRPLASAISTRLAPIAKQTPARFFHTTKPLYQLPTKMSGPFLDAIKQRRTYYSISPKLPEGLTESKIEEIVKTIFLSVPSSFNSQSTRAIVLFTKEHDKFWDFVHDALKAIVPAEAFPASEARVKGFKSGYGTILFFEDSVPVKKLQENFALYADKFPTWSQHTCAMHQFACWTALENEGLGANLQHYNPLIDKQVAKEWNVPDTWSLVAQMPFGVPTGEPGPKEQTPLEERLRVYGKSQ